MKTIGTTYLFIIYLLSLLGANFFHLVEILVKSSHQEASLKSLKV
jgi:hypothetical protein